MSQLADFWKYKTDMRIDKRRLIAAAKRLGGFAILNKHLGRGENVVEGLRKALARSTPEDMPVNPALMSGELKRILV